MKKRVLVCLLSAGVVVVAIFAIEALCQENPGVKTRIRTGQSGHKFEKKVTKTIKGQYLLFLPEHYGKNGAKCPLILFLHGSGERGSNLSLVKKLGPPKVAPNQKGFPFIVLSPQCPAGKWWTDADIVQMVMTMLDDICDKYLVDRDRIYLTGLSMGGFGTWALAQQYPNRFAAIAPVCGGGNPYLAKRIKHIPVRIYHGAKDKNVPLHFAKQMAAVLKQIGGTVQLFVFPTRGHNVWTPTYSNGKLYEWFLQHRRTPTKSKTSKPAAGKKIKPAATPDKKNK
ncbi:MAG: prolyl oligopeptidase family serine peptidase [Phycisphaerae bacterium]|nr:prolyl oligopeptidase family serine peptidase [Phycisphaerae bacterium]